MSHLVIARKYRPLAFETVAGQEHVTKTLKNSITRGKISHALLLTGPRGVGKTSIARIFSKCLNCSSDSKPTLTPCLECSNCKEIAQGTSLAVREIDGASNNSVDNVRELIENFRTLPAPGSRYKVYIIDEVHMLSMAAFNALLKSLEEPPPNTVFILATTEVHKIPETVLSRCQQHDLRALPAATIEETLTSICEKEGVLIEPEAVSLVARVAEGSLRDAETALERLLLFAHEKKVTTKDASSLFGAADSIALSALSRAIFAKNSKEALSLFDMLIKNGNDITTLTRDMVSHFRELLLAKTAGRSFLESLGIGEAKITELLQQSNSVDPLELQDLCYLVRQGADETLRSAFPKFSLESLIVRLATRSSVIEVSQLMQGGPKVSTDRTSSVSAKTSAQLAPTPETKKIDSATPPKPQTNLQVESTKNIKLHEAHPGSWFDFVKLVQRSAKMLAEQLKRVQPKVFHSGELVLIGTTFSKSYLEKKENQDKLMTLLNMYQPHPSWKIRLELAEESVEGSVAGSMQERNDSKLKEQKQVKNETILNSPSIQAIQNLFPGSKIEVKN